MVQGGSLTKPNMLLQPNDIVGLRRNKMRKTTSSPDIIEEETTKSATATAATAEATTTAATAEGTTTAATAEGTTTSATVVSAAAATSVEAAATAGPIEEPMTATEGPMTEATSTLNNKEQNKTEVIVTTTEVVAMEAEEEIEEVEIKKEQEEEVKDAEVEQKKPEEMETRSFLSAQQKKADMIRSGGLRNAITSPVDGSSQTGRQARNRGTTTTAAPTPTTITTTTITNRSTTTENAEDPAIVQETTSSPSETVTENDRHSSETTVAEKESETLATTATARKMRKKPPTNATDDTSSHLETTLTSLRGRLERLQLLANSAGHRRPASTAIGDPGPASESDSMAAFEFVKERTEPDRILIVYPNATVWPPLAPGGQQASKTAAAAKEEEIEASASEIKFPR